MKEVVFVVGATGYIGQYTVQQLLLAGYKVRVLVRLQEQSTRFSSSDVEVVVGDVTQAGTLEGKLQGVDYVISCLGYRHGDSCGHHVLDSVYKVLADGTQAVFRQALKSGVKHMVIMSHIHCQLHRNDTLPFDAFDEALRFIEGACRRTTAIRCTILNSTYTFQAIDHLFSSALQGGSLLAFGDGFDRKVNPIHGEDVARRLVAILQPPEPGVGTRLAEAGGESGRSDDVPGRSNDVPGRSDVVPGRSDVPGLKVTGAVPQVESASSGAPAPGAQGGSRGPGVLQVSVGGPEVLTFGDIAGMFGERLNRRLDLKVLPMWVVVVTLILLRVVAMFRADTELLIMQIAWRQVMFRYDCVAPTYGRRSLKEHVAELVKKQE